MARSAKTARKKKKPKHNIGLKEQTETVVQLQSADSLHSEAVAQSIIYPEPVTFSSTPSTTGADASPSQILPIIHKLSSTVADDRAWAAAAISNILPDHASTQQLLSQNLVGCLINALTVPPIHAQCEVAGALRNVAFFGGVEVIDEFYRKDILTPLIEFIPMCAEGVAKILQNSASITDADAKKDDQDPYQDPATFFTFTEQVLCIVWTLWYGYSISHLSESHDASLQKLTSTRTLMQLLVDLLNPAHEMLPWTLVHAAAQCLNTLTEDNPSTQKFFKSEPQAASNLALIASGTLPRFSSWSDNRISLRITCANVLYNVQKYTIFDEHDDPNAFVSRLVVDSVQAGLDYDFEKSNSQIAALDPSKSERLHEVLLENLNTISLALELASNAFCEDMDDVGGELDKQHEDSHDNEDDDRISESSEMDQDDVEEMQIISMDQDTTPHQISNLQKIQMQIQSLCNTIISTPDLSAKSPLYAQGLAKIVTRSLACLTNLFLIKSLAQDVAGLWPWLFTLSNAGGEIENAAVSALWALSKHLLLSPSFIPAANQVGKLVQSAITTSPIQCKCISILAVIGRIPNMVQQNLEIGGAIMQILCPSIATTIKDPIITMERQCECLDAIFDIYDDAQRDYDAPVFIALGYLARLDAFYVGFRARVKSLDKRKYRQVRDKGDECLMNLKAFLAYKRAEI